MSRDLHALNIVTADYRRFNDAHVARLSRASESPEDVALRIRAMCAEAEALASRASATIARVRP